MGKLWKITIFNGKTMENHNFLMGKSMENHHFFMGKLWNMAILNGKINYFYGHFQ